LLAGCSNGPSLNPVNWWHGLEGGKIAEQRPPPPAADQPYPNLASVPAKPEAPDKETMKKLTEALVADRSNAHYAAEAAPLPDPSSRSASPGLFGLGTVPPPPPPGQAAATASLPAASAPSSPAASAPPSAAPAAPPASQPNTATAPPPAAAPRKMVQSAPLTAPNPSAEAAQPPLPNQPPPPASVAGGPAAPRPPPTPGPMPTPAGGPATNLEFPRGSAALLPSTSAAVKQFAASHGKSMILVTGYGDTESYDPAAQTVALSLGLSRAQAVANALAADGVPGGSVRVTAEAGGRGVALRLLQ
jgi:outer membrane protein OmpA-like peptidoglycan-associated protein